MAEKIKVGILLCGNHCTGCAGGKCFKAMRERVGAFSPNKGKDVELELVGYASCNHCFGGHMSPILNQMQAQGMQVIYLSSGWICGYPPCPHINYLKKFIEKAHGLKVVVGTHPIPTIFYNRHKMLGSWDSPEWQELIEPTLADEATRKEYDASAEYEWRP